MTRMALVVDDSMLIRHTVCRFLEERGFIVEAATNGVEALERLKECHPDIVITDMMMPKMDGAQFIRELKRDASTALVPVIVLAGRQCADAMGPECLADATIWKDIDIVTQLEKALEKILGSGE